MNSPNRPDREPKASRFREVHSELLEALSAMVKESSIRPAKERALILRHVAAAVADLEKGSAARWRATVARERQYRS